MEITRLRTSVSSLQSLKDLNLFPFLRLGKQHLRLVAMQKKAQHCKAQTKQTLLHAPLTLISKKMILKRGVHTQKMPAISSKSYTVMSSRHDTNSASGWSPLKSLRWTASPSLPGEMHASRISIAPSGISPDLMDTPEYSPGGDQGSEDGPEESPSEGLETEVLLPSTSRSTGGFRGFYSFRVLGFCDFIEIPRSGLKRALQVRTS